MNSINGTEVPSNDMTSLKIFMVIIVVLSIVMAMGLVQIYNKVPATPPVSVTDEMRQEATKIWKEAVENLAEAKINLVVAQGEKALAVSRAKAETAKGECMGMLLEFEGKLKAKDTYIEQLEKTIQKLEQ